MLKQDNRKTRKKVYELPRLAVGDVLLVGKFKNRKESASARRNHPKNSATPLDTRRCLQRKRFPGNAAGS
jgi:hypothetical protein